MWEGQGPAEPVAVGQYAVMPANEHYDRARTLYALFRMLTTAEAGHAVSDMLIVYISPSENPSRVVLQAARSELRLFAKEVAIQWIAPGDFEGLEREFLVSCVDWHFPDLRSRRMLPLKPEQAR